MKKLSGVLMWLVVVLVGLANSQTSSPWVFVAGKWNHSCALTNAGKAYCWGENFTGALGINNEKMDKAKVPVPVVGDLKFSNISPGVESTCGLTPAGKAYCWGRNDRFQLGVLEKIDPRQTIGSELLPKPVVTELTFASISTGYWHTCGLSKEGKAYCWGFSANGELGYEAQYALPTAVKGNLLFKNIYAGRTLSCGLTETGQAYCWGANGRYQFGNGETADNSRPQAAGEGVLFSSLSLGESNVCGIGLDKKAYCWGEGSRGVLGNGDGSNSSRNPKPLEVTNKLAYKSISTSSKHTCALTLEGKAYCWGSNNSLQLGVPVPDDQTAFPTAVNTKLTFLSLYAANTFTCGMATDKQIYCWGANSSGQLGDDSTQGRIRPEQIENP
jgi:alpha-tubulin suppressor-like RCC1 family protein